MISNVIIVSRDFGCKSSRQISSWVTKWSPLARDSTALVLFWFFFFTFSLWIAFLFLLSFFFIVIVIGFLLSIFWLAVELFSTWPSIDVLCEIIQKKIYWISFDLLLLSLKCKSELICHDIFGNCFRLLGTDLVTFN